MNSKLLMTALLSFVMLVAACAPSSGETPTPADTPLIPETGGTPTGAATETDLPATMSASATGAAPETQAPPETPTFAGGPDVTVKVSREGSTPYLVDHQGRSLYVYMNDAPNTSMSACTSDCAVDWPPLVILDTPFAGEGVDIDQLGTLARDDGSKQVTFKGWPLYYYYMDTIPGTTNGQSYNGVWFLISADGEPIR